MGTLGSAMIYTQPFSVEQECQKHVKNSPMPVDRTIYIFVIDKVRNTLISNTLD